MIQPNRPWSVNLSKESLLKEIDDEIQKEYQILNKFSSEKFSLILTIFSVIAIIASIWPSITQFIDKNQLILFYLISTSLLFLFWGYWEYVKKLLKIPEAQGKIKPKLSLNFIQVLNANERDRLKYFLTADWVYSKKGEPHSWAFFIFLSTLVILSYANFQNWINIPHLNDTLILGIPLSFCLIIFSVITIIANYYLNTRGILWDVLLDLMNNLKNVENKSKLKMLFLAILLIIIGILMIAWTFFFYIFPIVLLAFFVFPNFPYLMSNFLTNIALLFIFTYLLNISVEFIAVPYGINLVENIKNEKIWWLETLKLEIHSTSSDFNNNRELLEKYYKKFDISDIYIPVPIQRFLIFQKYVFLPKWIVRPTIDIGTCPDSDIKILQERFTFHKNLIYRNIPN